MMMGAFDYAARAFTAWFTGFFPLAEIYVAVPAAVAIGLDDLSVLFWTVTGNFTPIVLIHYGYEAMMKNERLRGWLQKLVSEKVKTQFDRWGTWFVLLVTPWTGVWVMGVTAKALGIPAGRLMWASLVSITVYAAVILWGLRAGAAALG
ncbi:MAG: small multi-drug export protein [Anaerolineae bacterium]|jgi:uncharacterized membrane protein|nr:small multi-drug export protein [Anaerolineae bacterium]